MSIERLLQRIRDRQAQTARELLEARRAAACTAADPNCALPIGARVFDRVTGQEGEVIGGSRENIVVPAADKPNG